MLIFQKMMHASQFKKKKKKGMFSGAGKLCENLHRTNLLCLVDLSLYLRIKLLFGNK